MSAVLFDMIQADEMTDFLKNIDSTYQKFGRRASLYDTIFQIHAVSKKDFQQSLKFYQGRPDLLKDVLEHMQQKLADTTRTKRRTGAL